MTESAKTYTRIEAGEIFGVSNTVIRRNLQAALAMGFDESLFLTSDNRLTEEALEAIRLYRANEITALQTFADTLTVTSTVSTPTVTVESPAESTTTGIVRHTQQIQESTIARRKHTAALAEFEIPTIEIETIDVDVDDLRALLGLSTSRDEEANAYAAKAKAYGDELTKLKAIEDELDVAAIVADEEAKIEREQAIRAQVRASKTGKRIKSRAAVA